MKVDSIPSSTVKQFSSKSSTATMASCPYEEYPSRGFRLKRRTCALVSLSKHAADGTTGYIQSHRESTRRRVDDYEFAPRTPRSMTSTDIPPKLRLPSFDDDDNDRMLTTSVQHRTDGLDSLDVCVDLNHLFDDAMNLSDDDCSEHTCTENLFRCCLKKSHCE